jgi:diaminopimelate epimerase
VRLHFYKYHGAGNDFIIIDNRVNFFDKDNNELIAKLCDRRFGIGADGLMLLQEHDQSDFEMVYFNSDGHEGSLCGNGGRCIVAFANQLGIIGKHTHFTASDGMHEAEVVHPCHIRLKMADIENIEVGDNYFFLNTGSPHYVEFTRNLKDKDVFNDGRKIRYNERFSKEGTNVNFVEIEKKGLFVRTYERGVENETFACGTGIVASAISAVLKNNSDTTSFSVRALGGDLLVTFEQNNNRFQNIWLEGPVAFVYSGDINIPA